MTKIFLPVIMLLFFSCLPKEKETEASPPERIVVGYDNSSLLTVRAAEWFSENPGTVSSGLFTVSIKPAAGCISLTDDLYADKTDMIILPGDELYRLYYGTAPCSTGKKDLRILMPLFTLPVIVYVREGTGPDSLSGLKGKRINTGIPRSPLERRTLEIMKTAGYLPDREFRAESLDIDTGLELLKRRDIDALFWSPEIIEERPAVSRSRFRPLNLDEEFTDNLIKIRPYYTSIAYPDRINPDIPAQSEIMTAGVPYFLCVRPDFPPETARRFLESRSEETPPYPLMSPPKDGKGRTTPLLTIEHIRSGE